MVDTIGLENKQLSCLFKVFSSASIANLKLWNNDEFWDFHERQNKEITALKFGEQIKWDLEVEAAAQYSLASQYSKESLRQTCLDKSR